MFKTLEGICFVSNPFAFNPTVAGLNIKINFGKNVELVGDHTEGQQKFFKNSRLQDLADGENFKRTERSGNVVYTAVLREWHNSHDSGRDFIEFVADPETKFLKQVTIDEDSLCLVVRFLEGAVLEVVE